MRDGLLAAAFLAVRFPGQVTTEPSYRPSLTYWDRRRSSHERTFLSSLSA